MGYLPCPATDLVSSLAVPEGSDYLDGEDVYHHWLPPLVQSLADRLRGSQAGETSASVFSMAAHAGSLTIVIGTVTGKEKTLKAWFSVYQARPHLRGKNQSLRA